MQKMPPRRSRVEPLSHSMPDEGSNPSRPDKGLSGVLVRESLVGVLFNGLVFPYLIWVVNLPPPAALGGPNGVVASFTKATGFAVSLMTIILTLLWRKNAASGSIPSVGATVLAWSRFAPRNIVARAVFFVFLALATLMPIGVAVCFCFGLYPMTKLSFAAVNMAYGTLIGTVVTPWVTLVAMAESQTESGEGTGRTGPR